METEPVKHESPVPDAPLPPVYTPHPKPVPPYMLDRNDWIFAVCSVFVSLFCVCAGIWGGVQAGFTAAYLILFCVFTVYLRDKGIKPGVFPVLCAVLSLLLSSVCVLTSGTLVRFFAVALIGVLSVLWFSALAGKQIPPDEIGLIRRLFSSIVCTFSHLPRAMRSLTSVENARFKTVSKILLGLLCASPVLCAVVALLIRSDAAFEGFMQHMFVDVGSTAMQILIAACLFPFLLSFGFAAKKEPDSPHNHKPTKGMDTAFLSAFLGILSICYLVYLFTQLAYFFSAFSGILPQDYSFSVAEYARRGFFELCWIAGINLAVLYAMLLLAKKNAGKPPALLRILGIFIDVFTLFLIATAIAKMILYIREYGVTVLRIGTSAFMVFMSAVFLAMLLRFFLPKVRVLPVAAVAASLVVLVLGIGNVHAFAAWYNYTAFASGKLTSIDTAYLLELGDEGVPYLIALSDNKDTEIRQNACGAICIAIERRYDIGQKTVYFTSDKQTHERFILGQKTAGRPSQFSISRQKAYTELDALLQKQPNFLFDHQDEWEEAAERCADYLW